VSTIQVQLYNESIKRLCSSLILKSNAVAQCINRGISDFSELTGFIVSEEFPETWKYYLNISGVYHASDTLMEIVSLDTLQKITFDKVTLLQHRATLKAYVQGSTYYEDLVKAYPNQEALIRGILNPIDIQKAIAAPEFTIIGWDTNLIEANEHSLMMRLQTIIDAYVLKTYVANYQLSNDLYIHTFLGSIYALIPGWIRSIRKELCKTPEAHSFHIWNYLDSNGYLSTYKDFLTREQTMWLYRNIKWVYANAGNENTFRELMDVVLTKRGIPLGSYSLSLDVSEILGTSTTNTFSLMSTELMPEPFNVNTLLPSPRLVRQPLNMLTLTSDDFVYRDIDYVLEKELPLARDNSTVFDSSLLDARRKFARSTIPDLPTKVYESDMVDSSQQEPFILTDVLLNNWLYLASTNRYSAVITIANPFTGDIMSMNMREAFITLLYVYNKLNGIDILSIPSLTAFNIRRIPLPTFEQLRGLAEHRYVSNTEINAFLNDQVDIGAIISTESFYDLSADIHAAMLRHRMMYVTRHHMEERIQMELVVSRGYHDLDCKINTEDGQSYSEFFANRGWTIPDLVDSDLELLEVELLSKATGADTKNIRSLKEIQGALLRLMSQLGPYSSQYIQTINSSPVIMTDTVGVRVGDVDTRFKHLEYVNVDVRVLASEARHKQKYLYDVTGPTETYISSATAHYFDLVTNVDLEVVHGIEMDIYIPLGNIDIELIDNTLNGL
jgi:hypothetical protein